MNEHLGSNGASLNNAAVLRDIAPDAVVSVDTFRADVLRMCVEEYGVAMANDISGGSFDAEMFPMAAKLHIPYILMYARRGIEGVMTGVIWERYGRDDGRDEKPKMPLYKGVLRD